MPLLSSTQTNTANGVPLYVPSDGEGNAYVAGNIQVDGNAVVDGSVFIAGSTIMGDLVTQAQTSLDVLGVGSGVSVGNVLLLPPAIDGNSLRVVNAVSVGGKLSMTGRLSVPSNTGAGGVVSDVNIAYLVGTTVLSSLNCNIASFSVPLITVSRVGGTVIGGFVSIFYSTVPPVPGPGPTGLPLDLLNRGGTTVISCSVASPIVGGTSTIDILAGGSYLTSATTVYTYLNWQSGDGTLTVSDNGSYSALV